MCTAYLLAPCSSVMTAAFASCLLASLTARQVNGTPREVSSSAAWMSASRTSTWLRSSEGRREAGPHRQGVLYAKLHSLYTECSLWRRTLVHSKYTPCCSRPCWYSMTWMLESMSRSSAQESSRSHATTPAEHSKGGA